MNEIEVIHPELSDLAARIDAAVRDAEKNAMSTYSATIFAGRLLIEAKSLLPYGEWEQWVLANCTVAPRTAQAYMRYAKRVAELPDEEAQRVADLPLREAMRVIATAPVSPPCYPRESSQSGYINLPAPVLKSTMLSLKSLTRDIGLKRIQHDRIKSLREKLLETVAELDRMLLEAKP